MRENKLTTPFSAEKYKILWKKGNSVVAESSDGKIVRRNSCYFQALKDRDLTKMGQKRMDREGESSNGKDKVESENTKTL